MKRVKRVHKCQFTLHLTFALLLCGGKIALDTNLLHREEELNCFVREASPVGALGRAITLF